MRLQRLLDCMHIVQALCVPSHLRACTSPSRACRAMCRPVVPPIVFVCACHTCRAAGKLSVCLPPMHGGWLMLPLPLQVDKAWGASSDRPFDPWLSPKGEEQVSILPYCQTQQSGLEACKAAATAEGHR